MRRYQGNSCEAYKIKSLYRVVYFLYKWLDSRLNRSFHGQIYTSFIQNVYK